jgi:copper oxidase (laccase) domain-containing protein
MGFAAIDLIRACTRCSTSPLFCSYRRGDHGIRQYSGVMIAQSALNETIS